MRMIAVAVLATTLIGSAASAYAAGATGKIKSLNMTKDTVTLDNGSTYMAPKGMKLSGFKVGQNVMVNYTKTNSRMDITSIKPAA